MDHNMKNRNKLYLIFTVPAIAAGTFLLMGAGNNKAGILQSNKSYKKQEEAATTYPQREAFYGDMHLHTALSFDASAYGTRVLPDQSYKYGKGEYINFQNAKIKRTTPLDFMAVTDHSEYLGVFNDIVVNNNSPLANTEYAAKLKDSDPKVRIDFFRAIAARSLDASERITELDDKNIIKSSWQQIIEAANTNYEPGKFTTFIAYEWTSAPGATLHRNVFFRGTKVPAVPFSSLDSQKPEDLWSFIEENGKVGIDAIAIPHNPNISNGVTFQLTDSYGKPFSKEYSIRRAKNEPVTEMSQNKGVSETHPLLSPNDEFAGFEQFTGKVKDGTPYKISGGFTREALGNGLAVAQNTGVNPLKFGVIGSTDYHSGLTTSEEGNFFGNVAITDSSLRIRGAVTPDNLTRGSGGIAGVWAEQNTRDAIFDALKRKETFSTSGTRLKFRFFGGWDYNKDFLNSTDWVKNAYAKGVPMGGDLPTKPSKSKAPVFVIWAIKDPNSANLDRLQVIKITLKDGKSVEKIFDVALADNRKVDPKTGKVPPVGNTVDLKTATYTNTIGDTELRTVWTDPEFDPSVASLYYLRVLEIPTPRWSTIHAIASKTELPETIVKTIQERGWSSPIWYTPKSK